MEQDHTKNLSEIFRSLEVKTKKLNSRENSRVEFKESFNWAAKSSYSKSMAAFANNRGGYLIFGVTNSPRILVGLGSQNFENQDEATVTSYLNSVFSPEIQYEKIITTISELKIGLFYIHQSETKPVIAIKNDGDVREAEIYYRYSARSDKIKYPELKNLFDKAREQERS